MTRMMKYFTFRGTCRDLKLVQKIYGSYDIRTIFSSSAFFENISAKSSL